MKQQHNKKKQHKNYIQSNYQKNKNLIKNNHASTKMKNNSNARYSTENNNIVYYVPTGTSTSSQSTTYTSSPSTMKLLSKLTRPGSVVINFLNFVQYVCK